MKVKMKRYELEATKFAKRFTRTWDYWAIAKDAYLQGYQDSKTNLDEEVEVEITDGEHQLSVASFKKWKEDNK